jgi:hypothetical protein
MLLLRNNWLISFNQLNFGFKQKINIKVEEGWGNSRAQFCFLPTIRKIILRRFVQLLRIRAEQHYKDYDRRSDNSQ